MARRSFTREFKLEAIRLVTDHGVSVAQAARDLDLHENTLRRWLKQYRDDPAHAFPGAGQMKPEKAEVARLRREIRKLKAERDILKKASAYFAKELKCGSGLSRSIEVCGRCGGSARCSMSRPVGFIPG